MKIRFLLIFFTLLLLITQDTYAHSGRTDANGGHNCSDKSISKGLCTGYHYHNSGKTSTSSNTIKNNNTSPKNETTTKKEKKYDEISTVELYVNNEKVKLKNPILIKDNSNYFSIRDISNAIGGEIEYENNTGIITISKNNLKVKIDSKDKSIINYNDTTYASIRTIVSGLDIQIDFDGIYNRIYLTY